MGPGRLFALTLAGFVGGHLAILGVFAVIRRGVTREAPRVRVDAAGLRYFAEFVLAEAFMLTAALQLGVVRLSGFSAPRTLLTLGVGFVWWEAWFYFGHRLLHTRWLYPLHRPHHATRGLHPSLSFSAGETVVLSSGFYIPLALASQLYGGVSVETLALVFSGAYVLNVLSHLDVAAFEGTAVGPLLGSARRHARHHAGRRGNYGLNSAWLDRACGTEAAG